MNKDRAFADDLGRLVAALKEKHGVSDIDAATRLMMCTATLYAKNETEHGRIPSMDDFGKMAKASYLVVEEILKMRRAS